jgi:Beta-lactamase
MRARPSGDARRAATRRSHEPPLATARHKAAPFADVLQERLAEPLGMTRTFARADEVEAAGNHTRGLAEDPVVTQGPIGPGDIDLAWGRPAGLIWSSARDMARFVQFQLEGEAAVLSDEARDAMQSPQQDTAQCFDRANYGYGLYPSDGFWWFRYSNAPQNAGRYHPVRTVAHTGGIDGFSAFMLWLPDERAGYVILQNSSPYRPWTAMDFIHGSILPLGDPVEAPDHSGEPEAWGAFAGDFLDPVLFGAITVTVDETGVHLDMPSSPYTYQSQLTPLCGNTFVLAIGGTHVSAAFLPDADGAPNHIGFGGAAYAERVPPSAAPAAALPPLEERRARLEQVLRHKLAETPRLERPRSGSPRSSDQGAGGDGALRHLIWVSDLVVD